MHPMPNAHPWLQEMDHRVAAGAQVVRDQGAMAALGRPFRAHEREGCLLGQRQDRSDGSLKDLCLHMIGKAPEGRLFQPHVG